MFTTVARQGVSRSEELDRIARLPTRGGAIGYDFSPLRAKGGTQALRPIQAQALGELADTGGLFAPIPVGGGKTLISLLAPAVVGAKRPLLLIPAALRAKTLADAEGYSAHWAISVPTILSYEKLSRESAADALELMAPDLIILDECHKARRAQAAVTRRLKRYLRKHPETKVVAMSGTITNRSIHDYAHILEWCHKERSPLPRNFPTLQEWSLATDEGPFAIPPGALVELMDENERKVASGTAHWGNIGEMRKAARGAVRRRVAVTPGCLPPEADAIGASLVLAAWGVSPPEILKRTMAQVRRTWCKPDGTPMADAYQVVDCLRTLAVGGYHRWTETPPRAWAEARRVWCAFVRESLSRSQLDTELQVANACRNGKLPDAAWRTWDAVHDTFTPVSEFVWLSEDIVAAVGRWLKGEPGIVWVDSVAVGQAVSEMHKIPFFSQGGRCGDDSIMVHSGSCVASIRACGTGYNLQAFANALVLEPPANGTAWEQLMGRLHRQGQEADSVRFDVLLWSEEQKKALDRARSDAAYIFETTGAEQKLLYCDKAL